MNYYENFLIYKGGHYSVYFHAEDKNLSSVHEYYMNCDDVTRASLLFLAKRIGDTGRIWDETKFRIENRNHKIYCFKPKKERFFCFFFIGKKIVITSAYKKRRQKLDKKELRKAIEIRSKYIS